MSAETQETNETGSEVSEQPVESSQTPEQNPSSDVSSNADAEKSQEIPADKGEKSEPAWDAKTSYEELKAANEKLVQQIQNLQPAFTRKSQEAADMRKQIESLSKMIEKATKAPIDPKQFLNDFQTKGPAALEPLFKEREDALKSEFSKTIEEVQTANETLQYEVAKMQRRADSERYPDFQKLEPKMAQVLTEGKLALDFSQGADAVMDTLYNHVKSLNADQAIADAKALGKQEEQNLARKEAGASTAGGGKAGVTTDPSKLSLDEHRKMLINKIGLADDNGQ